LLLELFKKLGAVSLTEGIAPATAVLALCSFIVSGLALRVSKESNRLSNQIYLDGRPQLFLELLTAERKTHAKDLFFYVEVIISNPKDNDNSLKRVELKIEINTSELTSNLIIPATSVDSAEQVDDKKKFISEHERLPSRGTTRGWVSFKIDRLFYQDLRVRDRYLVVTDATGHNYSLRIITLNEVV
jgi:hypothetical protein